ncbi:type II 3-dehydroquinate dehydratase [Emergencia sp.]|uniref:type II 3-dehydroquinate dehydratase n=1 Tax=Emergencia sp. TaxID=1926557 RepID=UPI003AEF649D
MMKILVINGPNINMLGIREPEIYGKGTYRDLISVVESAAARLGVTAAFFQSNHEGAIVDAIQEAYGNYDGIVINPAAYTHTSVAILDALKSVGIPTVEVHISDVSEREDFRQVSYVRAACIKTIMGEGFAGYIHAMEVLCEERKKEED